MLPVLAGIAAAPGVLALLRSRRRKRRAPKPRPIDIDRGE